jgi:hypothetical protein
VSKLIAVSSFKRLDNFANDKGLMSAKTPPFVWCVLDARESVTSHNRVQPCYDFSAAGLGYTPKDCARAVTQRIPSLNGIRQFRYAHSNV